MKRFLMILLAVLVLYSVAYAGEAEEITPFASLSSSGTYDAESVRDSRYITVWASRKAALKFLLPEEHLCYGLTLCFSGDPAGCIIQWPNENGQYVDSIVIPAGGFVHQYIPLPGISEWQIVPAAGEKLVLSEVRLYGEGELSAEVQKWQYLESKADLMIVAAHPDDELIWFCGTIPTYAVERRKACQVVMMTDPSNARRSELLDGLWAAGMRYYPVIGPFQDRSSSSADEAYRYWGGSRTVVPWLTSQLRHYRPDVVLTHDEKGEYGHGAHMATCSAVKKAVVSAADPGIEDLKNLPPWQVHKVYIHLYPENRIDMNWMIPLSSFGGRTSYEVISEALLKHRSQQPLDHLMNPGGKHDCNWFGLWFSDVGDDVKKDDFLENIPSTR